MLDIEYLKKIISYDPKTGRLKWLLRSNDVIPEGASQQMLAGIAKFNKHHAGGFADTAIDAYGYRQTTINNNKYKAHRLAWAIFHEAHPKQGIDHIDGNPANNKIENLRDVAQSENCKNRSMQTNNKSGFAGVCFHKASGKYAASIKINRKYKHLGLFERKEDAAKARAEAEKYFGFHENHGRPTND